VQRTIKNQKSLNQKYLLIIHQKFLLQHLITILRKKPIFDERYMFNEKHKTQNKEHDYQTYSEKKLYRSSGG